MFGGVPARVKLYHMVDDMPVAGFEGFREDITFSPAEVYSPQDAPVGQDYAVYLHGERVKATQFKEEPGKHPGSLLPVRVRRAEDGRFLGSAGYLYQHWMREVPLTDDVQLATIGRGGYHLKMFSIADS